MQGKARASRITPRFVWACVAILACCASAGPAHADDLDQLLSLIVGDFDNRAQFDAQGDEVDKRAQFAAHGGDSVSHLGLQRRRVKAPALGEHVVYAQINHRADPSDVYRQSIMVFERDAQGAIIARNLRFADPQANRDILSDLGRFQTLTAADVEPALPEGCETTRIRDDDGFRGRVFRANCVMTSRRDGKPRRIQSTEFLRRDAILNEESGYREDGSMIFGLAEGVYYRYDRISEAVARTCDAPVIMVVSGTTLDGKRMGAYGAKIAETGVYAEVGGYYLNAPRPVAVFEGDIDPRHATLMVRFPCLENARRFWNSKVYQETIKPLRLNPSAGDYTVTVYREADLPAYMQGKVDTAPYEAAFEANLEQVTSH